MATKRQTTKPTTTKLARGAKPAAAAKPATKPAKGDKPDRVAIAKRMVAFRRAHKLKPEGAAAMAEVSLESWECCEGATSPTRRSTLAKVTALLDRWQGRTFTAPAK